MKSYNIFILILLFFASGCRKEWLNEKSNLSSTVPSTLQDFQVIMDNSGVMNVFYPTLSEVGTDIYTVADASFLTQLDPLKNAYTWSNEYPYINVLDWSNAYNRIFYCNIVLDGLKQYKVSASDINSFNNIKGQALFIRAKNFFDLAQIFIPTFSQNTASSDLGLPLRLEADLNAPSVRSSVKQTYDQIETDLIEAIALLPDNPLYKTRGAKSSAYALLARLYLNNQRYELAAKYSDLSLKLNNWLLDFTPLVPVAGTFSITYMNNEILFYCSMLNSNIIGSSAIIDTSLYNSYDQNDLRKQAFFSKSSSGAVSFRGSYTNSRTNFGGLTTSEMYLIKAESLARLGYVDSSMNSLNYLLQTRWVKGKFTAFKPSGTEEALSIINAERKKELIFRGVRWSDLRRLNLDPKYAKTFSRVVGGKTYKLEPNSFRYVLPLPTDVVASTGMRQNIGWE
jgi:hypothetical protein